VIDTKPATILLAVSIRDPNMKLENLENVFPREPTNAILEAEQLVSIHTRQRLWR